MQPAGARDYLLEHAVSALWREHKLLVSVCKADLMMLAML
jgi:hypothetical protein